jgi:flagellar capping protein FliD
MSKENKDNSMFDTTSAKVLERGLNAMTKMCDVLTTQNAILNKDVEKLKNKIDRMKNRLLENGIQD